MSTLLLTSAEREIIRAILAQFCPNAEVWVFGSRATGKAQRYSDIDLLIKMAEKIPFNQMFLLKDAFAESNLVFKVDVIDWHRTTPEFRATIAEDLQRFDLL